jgi:uncharacterized protein (TIGR00252 family)
MGDRGAQPRSNGRASLGTLAEQLAAAHLEASGFRIVARNWRRPTGELDLVADDEGTCVFVEVRSRTGRDFGDPLEAVDRRKQAQVIRAARLYLTEVPTPAASYVSLRRGGRDVSRPSHGGRRRAVSRMRPRAGRIPGGVLSAD